MSHFNRVVNHADFNNWLWGGGPIVGWWLFMCTPCDSAHRPAVSGQRADSGTRMRVKPHARLLSPCAQAAHRAGLLSSVLPDSGTRQALDALVFEEFLKELGPSQSCSQHCPSHGAAGFPRLQSSCGLKKAFEWQVRNLNFLKKIFLHIANLLAYFFKTWWRWLKSVLGY